MVLRRLLNALPAIFAVVAIVGFVITTRQLVEPEVGLGVFVWGAMLAALAGLLNVARDIFRRRFGLGLVLNLICAFGFSGLLVYMTYVFNAIGFRF